MMKKAPVPLFPKEAAGKYQKTIIILFCLSLLFFGLAKFLPSSGASKAEEEMVNASKVMAEAAAALNECSRKKGLYLDKKNDPNQTGLVGLEFSPITTSLGNLEAKRTTTNPNFAGLVVFLLKKAGVKRGDAIAVGASSSFPALVVAVLSAAKAMGLKPLVISSLGASQWGANNPDFHWLHMQDCLLGTGIFDTEAIALSLGGEKDTGEDMSSEGRSFFIEEVKKSGILFLHEPDLEKNVEAKMRLYEQKAGENRIRAFINIGGSWSNMGEDSEVLKLKPGLARIRHFPRAERRGVLYAMASRKIPVIHLLYIKGLAERYGLAWDPVPLPKPGQGKMYQLIREKRPAFLFLAASYFLLVALVLVFKDKLG